MKIIKNVRLIEDGRINKVAVDITVDNGVIAGISRTEETAECKQYVAAGYIDIHTHGAAGHDVSEVTDEALNAVGDYMLKNGVVAYLPTFVATPLATLNAAFKTLRGIRPSGADILGVHIEGPFISPLKKGAQPLENIKTVYEKSDAEFFKKNKDLLKIVTLCPATENAESLVKLLKACNVKAEAGHDDSLDYQIESCMKAGLDGATHLYCASSGFRRVNGEIEKRLGLNETALLYDDIYAEVIADGVHISKRLFNFIYKNKGFRKIILVSDSLSPAGAPAGEYLLGGTVPIVTDGTAAYLADKSALAGSITNLAKEVENAVSYGVPLAEAVYMATEAPKKYLGIEDCYVVAVGKPATFNILNARGRVIKTYRCGKEIKK